MIRHGSEQSALVDSAMRRGIGLDLQTCHPASTILQFRDAMMGVKQKETENTVSPAISGEKKWDYVIYREDMDILGSCGIKLPRVSGKLIERGMTIYWRNK